jgi:opacity protein-like surface antigen
MRHLFAIVACTLAATSTLAEEWTFSVEPYVLAANIAGDAGIGRVNGAEVDVDFSTILENLDMAAMIHFEAHSGNGWGFAFDYGFMDLSDDIFGQRGGVIDARVRQGTLEGLLIRQSRNETIGLEYFAGFRWWDNDVDVRIDPAILPGDIGRKVDASWIDLIVGARWTRRINNRWQLQFRGDIGGFGVESDFTSALAASAQYEFSQRFSLDLQYKALWVDFEKGKSGQDGFFSYDTVTHGPIIGLQINF